MTKRPGLPSVRILVVDDFEPFRRFVRSTLQEKSELQDIREVSDGLEAVQKAEELQPGLILLDISLPTLNGIEAARRIRKLAPESKIVSLSQESSADVVQEALSLGPTRLAYPRPSAIALATANRPSLASRFAILRPPHPRGLISCLSK
jgi:DNA-binding NarL/FixJ family response regulator